MARVSIKSKDKRYLHTHISPTAAYRVPRRTRVAASCTKYTVLAPCITQCLEESTVVISEQEITSGGPSRNLIALMDFPRRFFLNYRSPALRPSLSNRYNLKETRDILILKGEAIRALHFV